VQLKNVKGMRSRIHKEAWELAEVDIIYFGFLGVSVYGLLVVCLEGNDFGGCRTGHFY
jgi:hypothetical protein